MDTLPALRTDLPASFWDVPWDSSRGPEQTAGEPLSAGANCHVFAYAVLAHFGFPMPPVRSAELWRDTEFTTVTLSPRPLDLVLLHDREQAYGAHVGVMCSENEVLHLCPEEGRPAIWTLARFAALPRYSHLIGFKRPLDAT